MNDLTIVRKCAEAMGLLIRQQTNDASGPWYFGEQVRAGFFVPTAKYDPLHNDAQAMALVKKFWLNISHCYWDDP
jgi:hypothetical protein